jgi:hypothetical protein
VHAVNFTRLLTSNDAPTDIRNFIEAISSMEDNVAMINSQMQTELLGA